MDQFIADEFIARTNISKFKSHLQETSDHERKATLRQLLESEERRLATILAESSSEPSPMRTIQRATSSIMGNDS